MNYTYVSWSKLHNLAYLLTQNIKKSHLKFDRIVAVSRGGLTIGHILSDFLSLPITTISITSYKTIGKKTIPKISDKLSISITGQSILLVDDVADSGNTLQHAQRYLYKNAAKIVKSATLHLKPHSSHVPDFFVERTNSWLIYPSEIRETINTLTKQWKTKKVSPDIMREKFIDLKVPKKFIDKFLP